MYKSSWTTIVVVLYFLLTSAFQFGDRYKLFHLLLVSGASFDNGDFQNTNNEYIHQLQAPTAHHSPTSSLSNQEIVSKSAQNSSRVNDLNIKHLTGDVKQSNIIITKQIANFDNPRHSSALQTTDIGVGLTNLVVANSSKKQSNNKIDNENYTIITANNSKNSNNHINHVREKRNFNSQDINPDCEFTVSRKPAIYGIRSDSADVTDDGAIIVKAFIPTKIYLIGKNLYSNLSVALTPSEGAQQDDCTHTDRVKSLQLFNISLNVAEVYIELPSPGSTIPLYFCLREASETAGWFHQGSEPWLKLYVKADFLPFYMKLITIACLLGLSGIFSGLNLGLMALDKNELQVIMKCGSEDEKRYARIIEPVRRRGNYLLCSILFSNTLVNSTISVFLEELSDGLIAIMTSTVLIVLFGEILPQAFCSRHGLAVGAKTVGLTYFCMVVTFPLSYPVSYCLDLALGEEIGHAYDRERLMEFIQVTRNINNLAPEEVNIISGALKLKDISISEIMTGIDDVYMLDENSVLDFDTIQAIVENGYSRVPVHETGNRKNIKAVLFAKDLALVDPDDKTPVQTMISFYDHPLMFVYDDTKLDKVLNEFKTGRSHMALVQKLYDDVDVDPYCETIGIVTLEDVIEEIMQMEINDETDTLTDNRKKRRRKNAQVRKDFSHFTNLGTGDSSLNVVTPQLCLAAYQFLATTVEPFSPKYLSDSILRRLLSQKIFYKVRLEDDESKRRLYKAGVPVDYFIMILEGRVHVTCGKENLFFDGGPFSFYGKDALSLPAPSNTSISGIESISRRGSTINLKPGLVSRRESMIKGLSSHLTLSTKKLDQVDQSGDSGPSSNETGVAASKSADSIEKPIDHFVPDYTVDVISNTSYLKITRRDYLTAIKATLVERDSSLRGSVGGGDENDYNNQIISSDTYKSEE